MENVSIDASVLLFVLALTIVVGVVVGFAPAIRLLMTDVRSLVNEGGRGGSAGPWRQRMLGAMVVAEIALAVVVVIGAGLLVRSFDKLRSTDPGFRPEGVVAFSVNLSPAAYPDYDRVVDAYRDMTGRLRAINGVQSVSMGSSLPLGGQDDFMLSLTVEGDPPREEPLRARSRSVGETYFTTMGIRLVSGRELTDRDRRDTAPVVVVNEAFVRTFLPGQDPLGRQVRIPANPTNDPNNRVAYQRATVVEIVGVAADVRHASLTQRSEPSMYQPQDQLTYRKVTVMVRTSQEPAVVIDQIRREVASMDPSLPLEFRLLSQVSQASLSRQLLGMLLMLAFGSAALVLAAVGIYGVMAYSVAQRTRELAIRAALGASSGVVRTLIMRQGVMLAATGIVLGVMGALAMSRLVASQLYEVSPIDVIVFTTAPLLLFGIALMSSLIPAAVAGRVDPALMLRSE